MQMEELINRIAEKNPTLGGFLMFGMQMQSQMEANMEEWKDRLRKEWQETKKMPRKMKKRRRKEILLDWSIANWNPFEDYKI